MSSDEGSSFEIKTDDDYEISDDDYYYNNCKIEKTNVVNFKNFECLTTDKVEKMLNESAEAFGNKIHVATPIAKVLLRTLKWSMEEVVQDLDDLLIDSRIKPSFSKINLQVSTNECLVCFEPYAEDEFRRLECGHMFCISCWLSHFEMQLSEGVSTEIECMKTDCKIIVPEDFALDVLATSNLKDKYNEFALRDCVKSHPELRFCPGPNCSVVIRAKQVQSKRVTCSECKSVFCFECASDYHAPTDCVTIKKWLAKLNEDSELANYLLANTKDCPNCYYTIEKNGGCNHMYCNRCKYNFCWLCLGDWKTHGTEYYQCSAYNQNPNIAQKSQEQVRAASKKFEFYFGRWKNHEQSFSLEKEMLEKIRVRSEEKMTNGEGTWIEWQHLFDAAALLAKCRCTLKYTYAYAYFMEPGYRKVLFEYQQTLLETDVENLSWEVERAENGSRSKFANRMTVCEKRRAILLADFSETDISKS